MAKKEVKVTFRTITPLWTGDAWQQNNEIKPSSLIGSLRFWFEVICYFSGICKGKHFNSGLGRFEKEVNRENLKKCLMENGANFETQINCLINQDIPLPSIIFGTTNWKSLIEIKDLKVINIDNGYPFPRGELSFPELNHNDKEPSWYFKKGFYGQFEVLFNVEEKILESIFYPLLTFMDKYGYWGGKWNLGYGRLRVEKVRIKNDSVDNWQKYNLEDLIEGISLNVNDLIEEATLDISSQPFEFLKEFLSVDSFYCRNEMQLVEKTQNIPLKVKLVLIRGLNGKTYQKIVSEMLKIKVYIRNCLRGNQKLWGDFRHKLLGELGQGSKILPYTDEENGNIKAGFLSIAGLLNLEKEGENNG